MDEELKTYEKNRSSKTHIGLEVDSDFLEMIDEAASLTGFTRSEFVRMVLREKLEDLSIISSLAKKKTIANNRIEKKR